MISHPKLLPLSAVADLLGVHHKTLRKWVAEGRVPAYRVAGHTLRLDPVAVSEALLRPVTSTVHPARAAAEKRKTAPAPVSEAERRARMQASARRRAKREA